MVILSTLESIDLNESIKYAQRWFILAPRMQNIDFVNLRCVHNHLGPLISFRLYKKPRVIIHANLAFSMLVGQLIFVFGIDITPKVRNILYFLERV